MGRSRSRSNERKKPRVLAIGPKAVTASVGKWDEGFGGVYLPTGGAQTQAAHNPGALMPTVGDVRVRKLIVSGIPKDFSSADVVSEFSKSILAATGHPEETSVFPVVNCTFLSAFGKTKSAMVEFRTPMAARVALSFPPEKFGALKRGKDFPADEDPAGIEDASGVSLADIGGLDSVDRMGPIGGDMVASSPRLSVYGLPGNVMPEQIAKDLFSQFGKLRFISFPKDLVTSLIKPGVNGHVEYEEFQDSKIAESALNGFPCGNSVIKIVRVAITPLAPAGAGNIRRAASAMPSSVTCKILTNPVLASQIKMGREIGSRPSLVVQLLNAVYPEDIMADSDYNEIVKEVKEEASKFGFVESIKIPRTKAGVGKIFIQFVDMTAARKFQYNMNGRSFDSRIVAAAFYPIDRFLQGKYVLYQD